MDILKLALQEIDVQGDYHIQFLYGENGTQHYHFGKLEDILYLDNYFHPGKATFEDYEKYLNEATYDKERDEDKFFIYEIRDDNNNVLYRNASVRVFWMNDVDSIDDMFCRNVALLAPISEQNCLPFMKDFKAICEKHGIPLDKIQIEWLSDDKFLGRRYVGHLHKKALIPMSFDKRPL